VAFIDPPLCLTARGRTLEVEALNPRGGLLLPPLATALEAESAVIALERGDGRLVARIADPVPGFSEEDRARQPSVFSAQRAVQRLLAGPGEPMLGLYGAFGYDLAFQFEPVRLRLPRGADQRDLVLYLPDEVLEIDPQRGGARLHRFRFQAGGVSSADLPGGGAPSVLAPAAGPVPAGSDHGPGAYEQAVGEAREAFGRGDLFEVVLGQTFTEPCADPPSTVYRRLAAANPAPYAALINLGEGEFLVSASPEMYVRVAGRRVETCPISGTIARGADALGDAAQIRTLLNSAKDHAELTMCTDVDRNDKARVCEAGSVRVIGRRQIELSSRLIHTVDHVEGRLRPGLDALDAFLSHTWAVTVTGAPKPGALQFIEDHERTARRWYGGAFGRIGGDGSLDTGLTLRTLRLVEGRAEIRAGATLLHDSVPAEEDAECRLKASALFAAVRPAAAPAPQTRPEAAGRGRRILLVDHQDSFVHTLGDYLRQTGAAVETLRPDAARRRLGTGQAPDLVVLSPGPGRPADFALSATLDLCLARAVPVFGVCLGLQGMVEHFGGRLALLPVPVHGKASMVRVLGGRLLGSPLVGGPGTCFQAGRYHSLVADRDSLPDCLEVTAETEDGTVMAVEHRRLPLAAVQFHPESILTLEGRVGHRLIAAVMAGLAQGRRRGARAAV
jgi:anthranilate synthase